MVLHDLSLELNDHFFETNCGFSGYRSIFVTIGSFLSFRIVQETRLHPSEQGRDFQRSTDKMGRWSGYLQKFDVKTTI